MVMKIQLKASPSGCWLVIRNDYPVAIYPKFMWREAYNEARREAHMNNRPKNRGWV